MHIPIRRGARILLWLLAGILLCLAALALLLIVTKGGFLRDPLARYAAHRLGRDVAMSGRFELYPARGLHFHAENIRIANPAWAKRPQFFTAARVEGDVGLWSLLSGSPKFRRLDIDAPHLDLERDKVNGKTWSFGPGDPNAPGRLPFVRDGRIAGGAIYYADPALHLDLTLTIGEITTRRGRGDAPVLLSGRGRLRDAPFHMTGSLQPPAGMAWGGASRFRLSLQAADTRADLDGVLPGLIELPGARFRFRLRGHSLQEPFALIGAAAPVTRPYDISGDAVVDGRDWNLTGLAGRIGGSDIGGRLSIRPIPEDRLFLDGDLSSRTLDILDVGPILGMSPDALDAKGGKGAIYRSGDTPRLLPDAPLAVGALKRFDARIHYRAAAVKGRGAPFEHVDLTLNLKDNLLRLDPLAIDLAGGRAIAHIGIDARQPQVASHYDIALKDLRIGAFLNSAGLGGGGTTGALRGRILLDGKGDSIHKSLGNANGRIAIILPSGQLNMLAAELTKLDAGNFLKRILGGGQKDTTEIHCGLIAFTVKQGVAEADPVLIDTNTSKIRLDGNFNLDSEAIDLKMHALSKDFSLLSGQSPIGIGGYLAAPAIHPISGELAARTGAAVALGVLATPFAALLAFIDPGGADDANCAALLRQAETGPSKHPAPAAKAEKKPARAIPAHEKK